MNVLSLFDGLSGCRLALDSIGIKPDAYYASEIDPHTMKVSAANYPDIIRIGDVRNVHGMTDIDLMIFGSPCTDLSICRQNRQGLAGVASGLFYEALRILGETKPKHLVMENVASMSNVNRDVISQELGVEPVRINSKLLTAQSRGRYYWCNFPVTVPEDAGIKLTDILQPLYEVPDQYFLKPKSVRNMENPAMGQPTRWQCRLHNDTDDQKSQCQRASDTKPRTIIDRRGVTYPFIRSLTPVECERLQGIPDNYTNYVSNAQRYKMIGNGFTIPVIAHILKQLPLS